MPQFSQRIVLTALLISLSGCGTTLGPSVSLTPALAATQSGANDAAPANVVSEQSTVLVKAPALAPPEEILVAMAPGTRAVLALDSPMKVVREFQMGDSYQVVRIPAGMSRAEAIAKLQKQAGVHMVAPNRIYHASDATLTPNDPMVGSQWALNTIHAPQAWAKRVDASGITVAVIDTGIDYNHPELIGRVIQGPDLADSDGSPMDHFGHGTHVAGIIGAAGNNGQGIAGVAWNCKLMAIKVLGDDGSGSTSAVMQGIQYAADHGAKVINMSLGGSDQTIDPGLHAAMDYATQKGCVIVAAAGNEYAQVGAPANDPDAIAVSSTSHFWKFEWMSLFSNHGDKIEVAAPGGGILSTLPSEGSRLGSNYGTLSGTSMATPFVAGEAALIMAQHPDWSVSQVRSRIDEAVDHKGTAGRNTHFGYGRMDLAKALD
jgi:thermitase